MGKIRTILGLILIAIGLVFFFAPSEALRAYRLNLVPEGQQWMLAGGFIAIGLLVVLARWKNPSTASQGSQAFKLPKG